MKKMILFVLSTLVCGASMYAQDSQSNQNDKPETWDNGTPMTDAEYDHIRDVYLGGD